MLNEHFLKIRRLAKSPGFTATSVLTLGFC
jgi:hypothetical protein